MQQALGLVASVRLTITANRNASARKPTVRIVTTIGSVSPSSMIGVKSDTMTRLSSGSAARKSVVR